MYKKTANINKSSPEKITNVQAARGSRSINSSKRNAEGSSAAQRSITPERVQLMNEKYKNIRIPSRLRTVNKEREEDIQDINERPNDDNVLIAGQFLTYVINRIIYFDDFCLYFYTENQKLAQEISNLRKKCSQLEQKNERLSEDNEVLVNVNTEFGIENDELKSEITELRQKLEQHRLYSSFESNERLHSSSNDDDRSTKRRKSNKGKKPVRDISESDQDVEPNENAARVCNFVTLVKEFV